MFAENIEQEISAYTVVFFLFLSPPNDSKVNKVDFSNPDTQSWIPALRNSFCAHHAPTCSVVLQTLGIYSVMNLNGGNAVEPHCSCLSDEMAQFLCQFIKSTHSFQFPGFILIIVSLCLLNLEMKSFWT